MLGALRKGAGTWVVKIFLGVLALSFAVWGIGDMVRVQPENTVIRAGDSTVSGSEFLQQFTRDARQLQQQTGLTLDLQQARSFGLVEQTAQKLVTRAVFDQAIQDMDLAISDAAVAQSIRDNPAFRDDLGQFSAFQFEQALRQAGFSEDSFVSALKRDMARDQLLSGVRAGALAPEPLVDRLYRYRAERRTIELARLANVRQRDLPEPTDEEIAAYHQEHATAFTAPEYRAVTWVLLRPSDLTAEVKVAEDELRELYEIRAHEFVTLEQRTLEQIVLPSREAAEAAAAELAGGADFAAVADAAGTDAFGRELGTVTRDELLDELAEPAFALAEGDHSAPVESPLGWHVLRVTGVDPETRRSFEEVREQLEADIRAEKAADVLAGITVGIEDALAGGAAIEEIGREFNLPVQSADAVDARGLDRAGERPGSLPEAPEFLPHVFGIVEGEEPHIVESQSGSAFVARIDGIIQPALRPLEEVRDEVVSRMMEERRAAAAVAKAETLAEAVRGGRPLAEIAEQEGLVVETAGPFTRDQALRQLDLARDAITPLYEGSIGAVVAARDGSGQAAVIARLADVSEADPQADREAVAALRRQLHGMLAEDVLVIYRDTLSRRYGTEIDRGTIERILEEQASF